MNQQLDRRRILRLGAGLGALGLLSACDTMGLNFGPLASAGSGRASADEMHGTGSTRVALLLPLSGDADLAAVGRSMANAAALAIDYVSRSPQIGDNITLIIKDTGSSAAGAAQRASEAVSQSASLILGPLRGDQVEAAGAVAKSAGIPLIGFSNTPAAASPGVYLLNVLPGVEVRRSLGYAAGHGHRSVAAIVPATPLGMAQQAALQASAASLGVTVRASYTFGSAGDLAGIFAQLSPQLRSGAIDTLFMPDRATAPRLAALVQGTGLPLGKILLVGSADWDGDPTILATPGLAGAIYPAVDDAGYQMLKTQYAARFGTNPHPLATLSYTAVVLANAAPLISARYSAAALTMPGGFNGLDGVFRFSADGQSDYALVVRQVAASGARKVGGPKL